MLVTVRSDNRELTVELSSTLREQMLLELTTPASLAAATWGLFGALDDGPAPDGGAAIAGLPETSSCGAERHDAGDGGVGRIAACGAGASEERRRHDDRCRGPRPRPRWPPVQLAERGTRVSLRGRR
jgi:hypothetical protein